jgi:hypothetical protein
MSLESEPVRRFMKSNLGKRGESHNHHAAPIVIFFAAFKRADRAAFVSVTTVDTCAMSRFPKQRWEIDHLAWRREGVDAQRSRTLVA